MKTNFTYLGLGSNMGNRVENLQIARDFIKEKIGLIISESNIYETSAWGQINQEAFLNQVIKVETHWHPIDLIVFVLKIEELMGRKRVMKWEPRLIDIDILYYSDVVMTMKNLVIPHPLLHERRFVLTPLSEISPNFIHPKIKKTNLQLLEECNDEGVVCEKKF